MKNQSITGNQRWTPPAGISGGLQKAMQAVVLNSYLKTATAMCGVFGIATLQGCAVYSESVQTKAPMVDANGNIRLDADGRPITIVETKWMNVGGPSSVSASVK